MNKKQAAQKGPKSEPKTAKRALPEVVITFDIDGRPSITVPGIPEIKGRLGNLVKYVRDQSWRWGIWNASSYAAIAPHLGLAVRTLDNVVAGRAVSLEVWFRAQAWLNKLEAQHQSNKEEQKLNFED